jgi:hypothetical protein
MQGHATEVKSMLISLVARAHVWESDIKKVHLAINMQQMEEQEADVQAQTCVFGVNDDSCVSADVDASVTDDDDDDDDDEVDDKVWLGGCDVALHGRPRPRPPSSPAGDRSSGAMVDVSVAESVAAAENAADEARSSRLMRVVVVVLAPAVAADRRGGRPRDLQPLLTVLLSEIECVGSELGFLGMRSASASSQLLSSQLLSSHHSRLLCGFGCLRGRPRRRRGKTTVAVGATGAWLEPSWPIDSAVAVTVATAADESTDDWLVDGATKGGEDNTDDDDDEDWQDEDL